MTDPTSNPATRGRLTGTDVLIWAGLVGLAIAAYWPAIHGGFIWDDNGHVTKSALRGVGGLVRIWTEFGATQQYYPVLHSAFWLEHRLWGDSALAYHLLNVVLHCCTGLSLVAIMRRLALPGAWLAAAIFILHPLQVESVAWISEQKNTLSAVFFLGAGLLYLDYATSHRAAKYFAALALFVAAVLTKTVTGTLPAALLVVFWWRDGWRGLQAHWRALVPWLAIGAAGGATTAWVERHFIGAQGSDFAFTFLQRCLIAGRALCFYFGKLVWPDNLMFIYPRWTIDPAQGTNYLYLAIVVVALVLLAVLARRTRGPLAGFLIFAGMLFPALGFVNVYPFIFSFVADHFQYLACLGVIVPVCAQLTRWAGNLPLTWRRLAPVCGLTLVLILGVATGIHAGDYRSSEHLYRVTLERNPDCWMAHNNLGLDMSKSPADAPEAIHHFEEALRLKPDFAEAHVNFGYLLVLLPGRAADAEQQFEEALRLHPNLVQARIGLANALAEIPGRAAAAVEQCELARQLDPENVQVNVALGRALARVPGREREAEEAYRRALTLDPASAEAWIDLGDLLSTQAAREAGAEEGYRNAMKSGTDSPRAHTNLGRLLARMPGRLPEAVTEFRAVVAANPGLAEAHLNLGAALGQEPGQQAASRSELEAAVRLRPDLASAQVALANSLALDPARRDEAIAHYEAALKLDPADAELHYRFGNLLLRVPGRLDAAIAEYESALRLRPGWKEVRQLLQGLKPAN